jgi:hypothetical protein
LRNDYKTHIADSRLQFLFVLINPSCSSRVPARYYWQDRVIEWVVVQQKFDDYVLPLLLNDCIKTAAMPKVVFE